MSKYAYTNNWTWIDSNKLESKSYTCYNCGRNISSNEGYVCNNASGYNSYTISIYICHNCKRPTAFVFGEQIPGSPYGSSISHLSDELNTAYEESRKCYSVGAYTSSVLCCRKILMHIACEQGAVKDKSFAFYIDYLDNNNYIPPNGKNWVDKIRKLGNEATHELESKTKEDAELALNFTSMLLRIIYEFPKLLETT